ncbi:SMI1 / KNR4 family protein [Neisseria sp. oral taxon 020 str. F0370]|uniref:SMI1/KNR4 family protein n=1 Tax=unclassified Neisseria TaxID=2623750 RepID=UPI0002A2F9F2|nr:MULTISPECIES: SMI1/KNR4 family protein [unclassified Neisseria]ASP17439.1 hypothetical protein CGZ77_06595 [Neisseria sp. KEM232]EKY06996.1 SMI1 / KNR4 family protein [Neisseria sp. oral taxon 020 str. F0370]
MELIELIRHFFAENDMGETAGTPNTPQDIAEIEQTLNLRLNSLYQEIISEFGSCYLGLEFYDRRNPDGGLITQTQWFRQAAQDAGLTGYEHFIAIADNGSGDKILLGADSNELFLFAHDSGEILPLAQEYGGAGTLDDLIREYIGEEEEDWDDEEDE